MPEKKPKRIYAENISIDSDLFKLEVANFQKNLGFDDKKPILTGAAHCHFYRTFDSNGKKQTRCNFVGGHTHDVSIEVDAKGNFKATCSPAIGSKFMDQHIHEVNYIRSDTVTRRKLNEEAQKYIASMS